MEALLKGVQAFLCGNLERNRFSVTSFPARGENGVACSDNILVSDRGGRAIVLAMRRSATTKEFGISLVEEMVALQRSAEVPLVFMGVSKIPSNVFDRLSKYSIHVFEYPKIGMKDLVRGIVDVLIRNGWIK